MLAIIHDNWETNQHSKCTPSKQQSTMLTLFQPGKYLTTPLWQIWNTDSSQNKFRKPDRQFNNL